MGWLRFSLTPNFSGPKNMRWKSECKYCFAYGATPEEAKDKCMREAMKYGPKGKVENTPLGRW